MYNAVATFMAKAAKKQKRELKALVALRDPQIDLSDAPEVRDWSHAVVGKFYRPIKKSLTIRLDADVPRVAQIAGTRLPDSHQQASPRRNGRQVAPPQSVSDLL